MRAYLTVLAVLLAVSVMSANAMAGDAPRCDMCHPEKSKGNVVHPAIGMGCESCHDSINVSDVPHKVLDGKPKGLGTEPPDLCFNCHPKDKFTSGNVVHAPVAGGMCTSCHDPHASSEPALLKAQLADVCLGCHDKAAFMGQTVHSPVASGECLLCHTPHTSINNSLLIEPVSALCYMCHDQKAFVGNAVVHKPVADGQCMGCHKPHASQNDSLLVRKGNVLCRKCHPKVERAPHAIIGFTSRDGGGHPVRARKDPKQPGKTFGCTSCHLPHSSDYMRLFRYKAKDPFELCNSCHEF